MDSPNKTLILKYELKGHILNYLFLSVMDALALSEHELGFSEHETFFSCQNFSISKTVPPVSNLEFFQGGRVVY